MLRRIARGPAEHTKRDDRQLDDKLLVQRFSTRLSDVPASGRAAWVHTFTVDLLRIRYLFDQYILKPDATLTTGHESTTDDEPITARGFLDRLEAHALERLREAMSPDPEKEEVAPDGLPLGFAIPRIVYTYLDYLLVEEMNQWDFTLSYRTSVEHFSPGTEDAEHISDPYRLKNWNLLE